MTFATDELISSTKLVRNFSSVLGKMKNHELSKIGVLKNNELEAVVLSRDAYDKLIEYIEDLEDIALVEERIKNDDGTRYTMEEIAKECGIDLKTL
ncbi:MAG: prevent-host-death protein [Candidatus Gracilibacteria bacterium]|nr:prevent-host-death protein [Candidatus Gracilibacteria bacterium]